MEPEFGPDFYRLADRAAQTKTVPPFLEEMRLDRDALLFEGRAQNQGVLHRHDIVILGMKKEMRRRIPREDELR